MFIDIHTHHTQPSSHSIQNLYKNFDTINDQQQYSAGLHPWYITANWEKDFEQLATLMAKPHIVAVGECGLDRLTTTDWALQEKIFQKHIALANVLQKPLVIHCVKAWNEVFMLLKNVSIPVVFHGFNNALSIANSIIERGYYISFGKAVFKENIQAVLQQLPIDKIFLETDDSDITIEDIYKKAAATRNIGLNELSLQLQKNATAFFGKDIFL